MRAEQQGPTGQRALIETRAGGITWVHPDIYLHACAAVHAGLEDEIYQWYGKHRHQHRTPTLSPVLAATRRAAQRPFTDVLAEKGMDSKGIQRCQRQLTYEVTGKTPNVWKQKLGDGWMDMMPDEFQTALILARRLAARECEKLNLAEVQGYLRHFNEVFRQAAAPAKVLLPVLADLPEVVQASLRGVEVVS